MKLLTFNDANLEEHFAAHFGWRCRVPTFLLSLVMFLIWTTRLVSAQWRTDVPFLKFISGFLLVMAAFHLFNTVAIFRNPSLCCGEKRKATYVVFDAVACMFTVLVFANHSKDAQQAYYPARIISTPFLVYGIHAWSVPFGGFRLAADLYLHCLNFQVYLITKIQTQGSRRDIWPPVSTAFVSFCGFTLLPICINIFFEANVRSQYLRHHRISSNQLGRFWQFVLRWGVATNP